MATTDVVTNYLPASLAQIAVDRGSIVSIGNKIMEQFPMLTPLVAQRLAAHLAALDAAGRNDRFPDLSNVYRLERPGPSRKQRFVRIVVVEHTGKARSVHAFVNIATGDLHKSGGWKAPARTKAGIVPAYVLADDASHKALIDSAKVHGMGYLAHGSYLYADIAKRNHLFVGAPLPVAR